MALHADRRFTANGGVRNAQSRSAAFWVAIRIVQVLCGRNRAQGTGCAPPLPSIHHYTTDSEAVVKSAADFVSFIHYLY